MQHLIDVNILKIFVPESGVREDRRIYEAITDAARAHGLAQIAVSRGMAGSGPDALIYGTGGRLSEAPVIVEIVDTPPRIAAFLPFARDLAGDGCVTVQEGRASFLLPLAAQDIMTRNVATVETHTPLEDVVRVLLRRNIKAVPVMDGSRVAGIITGGDLLSRGGLPLRLNMHGRLPVECRSILDHTLLAENIMTTPVRTLRPQSPLREALDIMTGSRIKRLPVTGDDGILLGMISRTDVLAAVSRTWAAAARLHVLPPGIHAFACDILHTAVPTCGPDDLLAEILPRVAASSFRQIVVTGERKTVLGVVHDWNLLERCSGRPDLVNSVLAGLTRGAPAPEGFSGCARDVMESDYPRAAPETPLAEVIRILVERKRTRIVIADENGCLSGMVDRNMILRKLAER